MSPGSPDPFVAAESWVTALHTWDAEEATAGAQRDALLGWVGEEFRDVRIRTSPEATFLSAVEAAEAVVASDAVWSERRDAGAYSVFSPTRSWAPDPADYEEAIAAGFDAIDRSGAVLVYVEGLRLEVRGGSAAEEVVRDAVYVVRTDAPGRRDRSDGAWVVGSLRGLRP